MGVWLGCRAREPRWPMPFLQKVVTPAPRASGLGTTWRRSSRAAPSAQPPASAAHPTQLRSQEEAVTEPAQASVLSSRASVSAPVFIRFLASCGTLRESACHRSDACSHLSEEHNIPFRRTAAPALPPRAAGGTECRAHVRRFLQFAYIYTYYKYSKYVLRKTCFRWPKNSALLLSYSRHLFLRLRACASLPYL